MNRMEKDKGERLKDTITLLTQLVKVGISKTDYGYIETKRILDAWISGDNTQHHEIDFYTEKRIGHLDLYNKKGVIPKFVLKATEELKALLS
jgi:hypothetical protein